METETANTGITAATAHLKFSGPGKPGHKSNGHSIRCEVLADGSLALIPMDALGAYYLTQFGHGGLQPVWESRGLGQDEKDWTQPDVSAGNNRKSLVRVIVRMTPKPLLSKGDDPYYTGVQLSDDEQKACRALIDKMRGWTPVDEKAAAAKVPAKKGRSVLRRRGSASEEK